MHVENEKRLHPIKTIPAVYLPDARGWFKMVDLIELRGRYFLREGATHSEAFRRLLGEWAEIGESGDDANSYRGEWKTGSWETGKPVLLIRASDEKRGEKTLWENFFRVNPLELAVEIEVGMREARDN